MGALEIVVVAFGLALDALAVSLCIGAARLAPSGRSIFRLAFHFGLFQALMPIAGWLAGRHLAGVAAAWDHWIALSLLAGIGARMIYGGFKESGTSSLPTDPSRGMTMVLLSIAVSVDALAVGFSLAMLDVTVWLPALLIGAISSILSTIGLLAGRRLGERFGERMEILGGVVLVGIGLKILLSHTLLGS